MTDIKQVLNLIDQINQNCKKVIASKAITEEKIKEENAQVDAASRKLDSEIHMAMSRYESKHFESLKASVKKLVDTLKGDYSEEYTKALANSKEFNGMSFEKVQVALDDIFAQINDSVEKLNNSDFDVLVPPVKVVSDKESFYTSYSNGEKIDDFDCDSKMPATKVHKPLKDIVEPLFVQCKRATYCIDYLTELFRKTIAIPSYLSYVTNSANAWKAEQKAKFEGEHRALLDNAFMSAETQNKFNKFFQSLEAESKEYDVDVHAGTLSYKEAINIGDTQLLVTSDTTNLSIIDSVPPLKKNIKHGRVTVPTILDLKKCGNIFIETYQNDDYSEITKHFVNQLIIQFLLSFPPNRINFRLLDISNKMGFSPFKILTKINTDILLDGIIRDDRKLEDAIKDMEQLMYDVEDNKLSYNNVDDVFEYNSSFEANPQSVHLFVLVDYPAGMREDLAQRVLKIIQNGNKAGIFTILVYNKAIEGSYNYKSDDINKFVAAAKNKSVCFRENGLGLVLDELKHDNLFMPKKNITTSLLSSVVEMLQVNAESSKQKVVPITQLFEETDKMVKSPRGIPSSAEVLDIPIGVKGGEIQNLLLKTTGDGSAHAVVIGGTGSGKSNLLHTIIMNVCYKYSPEEVNLYLVDFKGGVEFKYYEANKVREKQMPHIKLTGLTSDLEDGVAILNNLHKELREREDTFRAARVEDIIQYRQLGHKMPRLFVIIDEIQELFEQDDKLGQKAIDILRELFKKGRAFGINILWASQNVPSAPGLKDKVLSQIGNRISLRLNEPDDAIDIKIDPKVVRNLNRPEKGLGVINDMRYGNDSIEFRVAYAENSNNRVALSQMVIDKWADVTAASKQEPLFIVGDDEDPRANDGTTIYTNKPERTSIISKAFESYGIQIGQDYITGKPFTLNLPIRENKSNVIFMGLDIEILRDLMGYSFMSVLMENMTNMDCVTNHTKIYYANGEMVNPKNSNDLFNVARQDFDQLVENIGSSESFKESIAKLYKLYKDRVAESENSASAIPYAPNFVVIHSLQRYTDLFESNPSLPLGAENVAASTPVEAPSNLFGGFGSYDDIFAGGGSTKSSSSNKKDSVFFVDAFKELLNRAGQFGIHFIISLDNPEGFRTIREEISQTSFKVFTKGISSNTISQILGGYGSANNVNNPKVALVSVQDERYKVRIYRYDNEIDSSWYADLCKNYRALRG